MREEDNNVTSPPFAAGEVKKAAHDDFHASENTAKRRYNTSDSRWRIPQETPNKPQNAFLSKYIISKSPTGLSFIGKSAHVKEVTTENIKNTKTKKWKYCAFLGKAGFQEKKSLRTTSYRY